MSVIVSWMIWYLERMLVFVLQVKETVSNKLYSCVNDYKDEASFLMLIKSNECFMPTMTEQCGYDSKQLHSS